MAKKEKSWWYLNIHLKVKNKDKEGRCIGWSTTQFSLYAHISEDESPINHYHERVFAHPNRYEEDWLHVLVKSREKFLDCDFEAASLTLVNLTNQGKSVLYKDSDLKKFEKLFNMFYHARWGTGLDVSG